MRRDLGFLVAAAALVALAGLPAADSSRSQIRAQAAAAERTVHFTAAGDYASGPQTQSVLATIASLEPDLHLALGGLSYVAGTEQAWCDGVVDQVGAGFPVELVAGTGEADGTAGHIADFAACLPNQLPGVVGTYGRQWYVDMPARDPLVRFVLISPGLTFPDGTDAYALGDARYTWTANAIDGARAASIPWVVVGMHQPCLTTASRTCGAGADLLNLLVTKQVDLVLAGHEHLYERTKQLALAPRCVALVPGSADPDCVADGDATLVKGAGTVLVTVGTGGIAQNPQDREDTEAPYFAAASGRDTAAWGVLDVRATPTALFADFVRSAGSTFTDSFAIRPAGPDQNSPPVASFTSSCDLLTCTVDAAGSTDPDGTIDGFAWSFGDGSTGAGASTTHEYAAAGTYAITLTVTDSSVRTGSALRIIEVAPTVTGVLAADSFERDVAAGFGSAVTGGDWTVTEGAAVTGGAGRLTLTSKGAVVGARLPAVNGTTATTRLTETWDRRPDGSGGWLVVRGRITPGGEYRLRIGHKSDGEITARIVRTDAAGAETAVTPEQTVPLLAYTGGTRIAASFEVTGTGPTGLRAKVWAADEPEPAGWLIDTADATPELQVPGHPGVAAVLSGATTNVPVTVSLDDLTVVGPGGAPAPTG
ncbi:PKD domain-containing protein [Pengzhenrongella sicca]|uniref:PKD domain-containing protein n=1 Tax=Pengzhenrongella sicca TaxID=2819238 RepID=A0A8A4ZHR0_9MICO|nr:PKD domain-containing protein [Pengzhenrongella sicca]QTE30509.1 PKD domain-containing protein [Pengzhenrongella sicca]